MQPCLLKALRGFVSSALSVFTLSSSRVCLYFPILINIIKGVDCPGLISALYIPTAVAATAYHSVHINLLCQITLDACFISTLCSYLRSLPIYLFIKNGEAQSRIYLGSR